MNIQFYICESKIRQSAKGDVSFVEVRDIFSVLRKTMESLMSKQMRKKFV